MTGNASAANRILVSASCYRHSKIVMYAVLSYIWLISTLCDQNSILVKMDCVFYFFKLSFPVPISSSPYALAVCVSVSSYTPSSQCLTTEVIFVRRRAHVPCPPLARDGVKPHAMTCRCHDVPRMGKVGCRRPAHFLRADFKWSGALRPQDCPSWPDALTLERVNARCHSSEGNILLYRQSEQSSVRCCTHFTFDCHSQTAVGADRKVFKGGGKRLSTILAVWTAECQPGSSAGLPNAEYHLHDQIVSCTCK